MTPEHDQALLALTALWPGTRLFMVGAQALVVHRKMTPERVTHDLDLAIDVAVEELQAVMLSSDHWRPDPAQEQRWLHHGGAPVDLVAIGGNHLAQGFLQWPRTGARMNLAGFELLAHTSVKMEQAGHPMIELPPPEVIAILKMAAWLDRPAERGRDLEDLAHLCDHYLDPLDERMFLGRAAELGLFDESANAYLLGLDIGRLLRPDPNGVPQRFLDRMRTHAPSLIALVQRWSTVRDEADALERLSLLEDGLNSGPGPTAS